MLAIAIAAPHMVLFDNVTRMLVSDVLDMVLTSGYSQDRVLGRSEQLSLPARTVLAASSNNATISTDLVRRSIRCRLESLEEEMSRRKGPKEGTPWKHPNIHEYARKNCQTCLRAALTILVGYQQASRPAVDGLAVGGVEDWAAIVRDAVMWAGLSDPAVTQEALREAADVDKQTEGDLFRAWLGVFGEAWITVRDLLKSADEKLQEAIGALHGSPKETPSAALLGKRPQKLIKVVSGGLVLERSAKMLSGRPWRVRSIDRAPLSGPLAGGNGAPVARDRHSQDGDDPLAADDQEQQILERSPDDDL